MTVSVVICTRDRPGDLILCLGSLATQTRLPDEVIVVDAGRGGGSRDLLRAWAGAGPVAAVAHLPAAPGLARQRNLGAARARGDLVTFLDDDVVLDPGYLAAIVELFQDDAGLGGAEGTVRVAPLAGRRRIANGVRRFFGMCALGGRRGVGWTGFNVYDPWPRAVRPTNCLVGCNMTYRRSVLREYRFDEWFSGYGFLEDQDFSYRVSRRHRLAQTPHARLRHRISPVARAAAPALHEMGTVNHFYFVRKNLPATPLTWLGFAWSELGELLAVLKTGDPAAVAGRLRGYRRIVRTLGADRAGRPLEEAS
jgi:GT2 family glycosyltransferase